MDVDSEGLVEDSVVDFLRILPILHIQELSFPVGFIVEATEVVDEATLRIDI